jgi:hypothetical protein
MPRIDPASWSDRVRRTLERYDEALVRQVAARLIKPRNQWPVEELIERCVSTLGNPAVLDRRLQELEPAQRRLLALIGHSRQPRWRLGSLLEMLAALGHAEGPGPVLDLFEAGLLYPDLLAHNTPRLQSFEAWLGQGSVAGFPVFAHPDVTCRALEENLGLPELPSTASAGSVHEADGLEWMLRLAVLWQQVVHAPLRRTQQGDFFKRDLDRLRSDPLLGEAPADGLAEVPDVGLLAVALAEAAGLLHTEDNELRTDHQPQTWDGGLADTLASIWAALPRLQGWNARDGWHPDPAQHHPFAAAYLLAILLLSRLPPERWARPEDIQNWLVEQHPYWAGESVRPSRLRSWVAAFLLGWAYQLRVVQASKGPESEWLVRLSPWGRWLVGLAEQPPAQPGFPQTLLVQPNLEILAYRQGLTPPLIGRLSRFATFKTLGAACTLQLEPGSVYRALESGLTFETILLTLEQHGMRPTPPSVVESLRTWANKRERISVYPSASLFEFASADELNDALARGLPGVRLSDRLAVVTDEGAVDYRNFRLTGTRDYGLPPEKCVEVEPDGVTLSIDLARSDLLLETELHRFAEPLDQAGVNGRRRYRLTPESLAAGRESGLSLRALEEWFTQRSGQPLSASARLLQTASQLPPAELKHVLVLAVATPELADGLMQWPGTRGLIESRLGPTSLAVAEENVEELRRRLGMLGMNLSEPAKQVGSLNRPPAFLRTRLQGRSRVRKNAGRPRHQISFRTCLALRAQGNRAKQNSSHHCLISLRLRGSYV